MRRGIDTGTPARRRAAARLRCTTALALVLAVSGGAGAARAQEAVLGGSTIADGGTSDGVSASVDGTTLTITQSGTRGVVNWEALDLGGDETLNYLQPSVDAVTLNRAAEGLDSGFVINGDVFAPGSVWFSNPNGVLIGETATLDVGGLMATTATLANEESWLSESSDGEAVFNFDFNDGVPTGAIRIGSAAGGAEIASDAYVVVVAPEVEGAAPDRPARGDVAVASGGVDDGVAVVNAAEFAMGDADGLIRFDVDDEVAAELRLDGLEISTPTSVIIDGGDLARVQAGVVNVDPLEEASGVTINGGEVVLTGGVGAGGDVDIAANGDVASADGVTIETTRGAVAVAADLDADGAGDIALADGASLGGVFSGDNRVDLRGVNVTIGGAASGSGDIFVATRDQSGSEAGGALTVGGADAGDGFALDAVEDIVLLAGDDITLAGAARAGGAVFAYADVTDAELAALFDAGQLPADAEVFNPDTSETEFDTAFAGAIVDGDGAGDGTGAIGDGATLEAAELVDVRGTNVAVGGAGATAPGEGESGNVWLIARGGDDADEGDVAVDGAGLRADASAGFSLDAAGDLVVVAGDDLTLSGAGRAGGAAIAYADVTDGELEQLFADDRLPPDAAIDEALDTDFAGAIVDGDGSGAVVDPSEPVGDGATLRAVDGVDVRGVSIAIGGAGTAPADAAGDIVLFSRNADGGAGGVTVDGVDLGDGFSLDAAGDIAVLSASFNQIRGPLAAGDDVALFAGVGDAELAMLANAGPDAMLPADLIADFGGVDPGGSAPDNAVPEAPGGADDASIVGGDFSSRGRFVAQGTPLATGGDVTLLARSGDVTLSSDVTAGGRFTAIAPGDVLTEGAAAAVEAAGAATFLADTDPSELAALTDAGRLPAGAEAGPASVPGGAEFTVFEGLVPPSDGVGAVVAPDVAITGAVVDVRGLDVTLGAVTATGTPDGSASGDVHLLARDLFLDDETVDAGAITVRTGATAADDVVALAGDDATVNGLDVDDDVRIFGDVRTADLDNLATPDERPVEIDAANLVDIDAEASVGTAGGSGTAANDISIQGAEVEVGALGSEAGDIALLARDGDVVVRGDQNAAARFVAVAPGDVEVGDGVTVAGSDGVTLFADVTSTELSALTAVFPSAALGELSAADGEGVVGGDGRFTSTGGSVELRGVDVTIAGAVSSGDSVHLITRDGSGGAAGGTIAVTGVDAAQGFSLAAAEDVVLVATDDIAVANGPSGAARAGGDVVLVADVLAVEVDELIAQALLPEDATPTVDGDGSGAIRGDPAGGAADGDGAVLTAGEEIVVLGTDVEIGGASIVGDGAGSGDIWLVARAAGPELSGAGSVAVDGADAGAGFGLDARGDLVVLAGADIALTGATRAGGVTIAYADARDGELERVPAAVGSAPDDPDAVALIGAAISDGDGVGSVLAPGGGGTVDADAVVDVRGTDVALAGAEAVGDVYVIARRGDARIGDGGLAAGDDVVVAAADHVEVAGTFDAGDDAVFLADVEEGELASLGAATPDPLLPADLAALDDVVLASLTDDDGVGAVGSAGVPLRGPDSADGDLDARGAEVFAGALTAGGELLLLARSGDVVIAGDQVAEGRFDARAAGDVTAAGALSAPIIVLAAGADPGTTGTPGAEVGARLEADGWASIATTGDALRLAADGTVELNGAILGAGGEATLSILADTVRIAERVTFTTADPAEPTRVAVDLGDPQRPLRTVAGDTAAGALVVDPAAAVLLDLTIRARDQVRLGTEDRQRADDPGVDVGFLDGVAGSVRINPEREVQPAAIRVFGNFGIFDPRFVPGVGDGEDLVAGTRVLDGQILALRAFAPSLEPGAFDPIEGCFTGQPCDVATEQEAVRLLFDLRDEIAPALVTQLPNLTLPDVTIEEAEAGEEDPVTNLGNELRWD